MKETHTQTVKPPRSLKEAIARFSPGDRTGIDQTRADFEAFDKIMKRKGGQAPRKGDEMPE